MTHGLLFHYFHNDKIRETQGSIDAVFFESIIDEYSKKHTILCAEEYLRKAKGGRLKDNDVCLTFDDGLSCQYEIADKVLQKKGMTAFYFVYTSPLEGKLEKIEVYRSFRNKYKTMDAFYADFFDELIRYGNEYDIDYKTMMQSDEAKSYFSHYGYYSENDRLFRYFRNEVLRGDYDFLMNNLMQLRGFDAEKECCDIWIDSNGLNDLESRGNIIGLHSHSHFTSLKGMSYEDKKREYLINKETLEKCLSHEIQCASYPCDTYDSETVSILKELGVSIAFIAHMDKKSCGNKYRISRKDSSEVLKGEQGND